MELNSRDRSSLNGELGAASQFATQTIIAVGQAEQATSLVNIESAHIDGCLFHGQAGLDFARRLVEGGGQVAVPTTLNIAAIDLLHPALYRGDAATADAARELMDHYVTMGCEPTWTCAPYLERERPGFGQQIAWGESNAIVFANSVLGARTARYGDFMDICCAISGRAPYVGLHTDEGRLGTIQFDIEVPDEVLDRELFYPLLGHALGRRSGNSIPVLVGLDSRADEDRLRALGAAAASAGSVAMFHVVGITPEAPTLSVALGGRTPESKSTITLDDLAHARSELDSNTGSLGAVSLGTPHMSLSEMRLMTSHMIGNRAAVPFFVNTSRTVLAEAESEGLDVAMSDFGVTVVTDTCTYVTAVMGEISGDVMTNSGRWAYYAPANLGVTVSLASTRECVESAIAGRRIVGDNWWY